MGGRAMVCLAQVWERHGGYLVVLGIDENLYVLEQM